MTIIPESCRRAVWATAVLLTFCSCGTLSAQTEKADLPNGEEVVRKYIEASGGQAAYDKIENRVTKMTVEFKNAGITLDATVFAARPNKFASTMTAAALGTISQGCNGEAAWSISDMQGPVVEQGAALENRLRDSRLDRMVYWKQAYQSVECRAIEKVRDRECYKVVFTPLPYQAGELKDAETSLLTVYFDKESWLPLKIESNIITEAGTIDVTAFLSDYRDVDGIKIAWRTELELMGQSRVMEIESVKQNVELAADQFDPPPEIRKLLKK
jgi:outer membrane lipoprotein-sorting protein